MTLKKYVLPLLILIMGLLYIFIIPSEPVSIKILFKLIPMWLIIFYAFRQFPTQAKSTHWILFLGLIFCMFGDFLIQWWFVYGLAAFLIGHLFYLTGFFKNWSFSIIRFAMIIPIAVYAFIFSKRLLASIIQDGNSELFFPVLAYVIIISLMAWSAIMTGDKWAMIGSILFVISDSILSWNMFVSDIPYSNALIMSTYYTAQFFIASSIRTLSSKDTLSSTKYGVVKS
ncbi:lysoplasmalogenase [Cytobacillus dafuensis]|uniref:Lysoplasmalogenase n=1 Tax=Cytobacillus dafuensis TaxID=1742359 RepID=A0A5B8ZA93_CYTDA|nr:lysoplasmalogenase [Cytobacillus dafuensis]QED49851.1 lysoplasmalogenase [Cytobacillus dafuensis]